MEFKKVKIQRVPEIINGKVKLTVEIFSGAIGNINEEDFINHHVDLYYINDNIDEALENINQMAIDKLEEINN